MKHEILSTIADAYEICGRIFEFPNSDLVELICNRAILDEIAKISASLEDGGYEGYETSLIENLTCENPSVLLDNLKKEYSILFLTPGAHVPIWIYEAPFRFVQDGREGSPSLFRSPTTIDVEKRMVNAGLNPPNRRKEPIDSMSDECYFISLLLRDAYRAIETHDLELFNSRLEQARDFNDVHLSMWMQPFMLGVIELSRSYEYGASYASFADFGKYVSKLDLSGVLSSLDASVDV